MDTVVVWSIILSAGYVKPDRKAVIRVIADFVRQNGLVGTPGGQTLYVSDHGAKKVHAYDINADGSLSNKRFFAPHSR